MDYVLLREANDFVLDWNAHPGNAMPKDFVEALKLINRLYNALYEISAKSEIKELPAHAVYEFRYEAFPFSIGGFQSATELGKDGWELVNVYTGEMSGHTMSVAKYRRRADNHG